MDSHHLCSSIHDCFSAAPSRISKTSLQDRPANPYIINGKVVIEHSPGLSGPGKSASLQLYSSTELDPKTINLDTYVPPDERFSPKKLSEFIANAIQATAHFLLPEAKSLSHDSSSFESFDEIRNLYSDNRSQVMRGTITEKMKKLVPAELIKQVTHASKQDHIKFPLPQIIRDNEWAWTEDEEFGHQMLAGTNPMRIQSLK
ncbi:hypothetical protein POUND7_012921, partial [Theobroma cacao]